MAERSIRERSLVVFDDPELRGVGIVAQEFGNLGYRTVALSDFSEDQLKDVDLLLTISIPLEKLGTFLEGLHRNNPARDYRIALILPERNLPKSELRFFDSLDPATFDGIAHVSTVNLLHWREKFPDKIHGYFQNPSTLEPGVPKTHSDSSVISSGVFTTFKGLGVLLKGASELSNFPELTFSYTGCQFQFSGRSGKIVGSPELVTSLTSDLKEKTIRPNIVIQKEDDWSARVPGGVLNVFPSYSNRAENSRRIAESGVYLFTPCAILKDEDLSRSHIRQKNLQRWASAVDYNLLEAMASGTPVLFSHGYHSMVLAELERYSREKMGVDLSWKLPLYDDLREAASLARSIVDSPDYAEYSQHQLAYFLQLRNAANALLEEDLAFFLGAPGGNYRSELEIPKGTRFFREAQLQFPSDSEPRSAQR